MAPRNLQHLSPDLLKLIILVLMARATTFDKIEEWHAILALTTTCHSLSEVALDELWAEMPSLTPIVYTLPRDSWIRTRQDDTASDVLVSSVQVTPMT